MTFEDFSQRCLPAARDLEDRSLRYISSPQDHDLAWATAWRFVMLFGFKIGPRPETQG